MSKKKEEELNVQDYVLMTLVISIFLVGIICAGIYLIKGFAFIYTLNDRIETLENVEEEVRCYISTGCHTNTERINLLIHEVDELQKAHYGTSTWKFHDRI